jgi:hypothetical protein
MKSMRAISLVAIVLILVVALALPAFAAKNCWGVVTSQRAVAEGDMGEHSSSFDEPRLGLGNVTRLFEFDHISELGTFLASVDGIEATGCD